jgi:GT2 family glycosyltransferase
MKSSISVVIPNYNGKELLEKNIPSIYSALKSSNISEFEIIISDDASSDDSVDFIKANYKEIVLLENKVNKGFSGNSNTGIFKAEKDLVFILNSDVVLTDRYFNHLLPYFDDPDTFGVMSKIIAIDSDKIQDGAKYHNYSFGNIGSCKNYISQSSNSLYSFFLSGANALIDRNKLIELNGFNELFNPYFSEDVDLGLRAWRIGYKCYYEHRAICRHPNSATIKKEPSAKVLVIAKRNKIFLHFFHLHRFELFSYFGILILKTIFKTLTLDTTNLKSVQLFFSSFEKYKKSKLEFTNLQLKKHKNISVRDVAGFIRQKIGKMKIETF